MRRQSFYGSGEGKFSFVVADAVAGGIGAVFCRSMQQLSHGKCKRFEVCLQGKPGQTLLFQMMRRASIDLSLRRTNARTGSHSAKSNYFPVEPKTSSQVA